MVRIFISLYDFFKRRRIVFWIAFISLLAAMGIGASQIKIEEDITRFFPDDKKVEDLNYVFQNSKFAEQLVVMVSVKDSTSAPQPDSLVAMADNLIDQIDTTIGSYVKGVRGRVDDEKILEVFNTVHDHLPVFLNDDDYRQLDSLLRPENASSTLLNNYNQLISPIGVGIKKIIARDPLGFSFLALRKLNKLQYDETFQLYDGYIISKDRRHLLFFITPAFPPIETGNNTHFIEGLNSVITSLSANHPFIKVSYFGSSAVAVGNAVQLRSDTIFTVSLMVILLSIFLIGFFKRKRIPFLIFIPVGFGALFSLCCIFIIKGSVSILALAAGSFILGIAVNYALHFLAHFKHIQSIRTVVADLSNPMTIGSITTVLAFLCLQFTNAAVLRDVGLFAGLSLVGAALCSLIFLPHLVPADLFQGKHGTETWIERIPFAAWSSKKYVLLIILLATPVFFYFAGRVSFDNDVNNLNFMSEETSESKLRLETINQSSANTVFILSRGKDIQEALQKNEKLTPVLEEMEESHQIHKYSSVSVFLISDSLQTQRIKKWNSFWTPEKKQRVSSIVHEEGKKLKFADFVLTNFDSLIQKRYVIADSSSLGTIRASFFDDYIIEKDTTVSVITLVNVKPAGKASVYQELQSISAQAFDRQMLANLLVKYVNADFNFIVLFTGILVFVSLLISYGRIELTLITFVPMFITWIWILGIMALIGIQFNIVNVMVSTFIFGLGDDYSIFIMDGLQQEFKAGKKNLSSIRTSIFLSAVTTIAGLGVLIFAKHPAMRSIAAISIIGIVCVFIMSQTVEPYLFRALITRQTERGRPPRTLYGLALTFFTYAMFIGASFVLTIVGFIFRLIPFGRKRIKLIYHSLISFFSGMIIYLQPHIRKRVIGKSAAIFSEPSVIIANHSSVVDILLMVLLHPKLILITNQWVWESPIMGGVVRLADFYPVSNGVVDNIDKIGERVKEGYSIVIFPEGTRSPDTVMRRFHKGAFHLAEALSVPIQPVLIHGAGYAVPKGTFYLNPGQFTLKFLPAIRPENDAFGSTYTERTKKISKYFKEEYASLASEIETPDYYYKRLISNYLYKGPVLEWYLRVKLRLEQNYATYYNLLPRTGPLLDLGCGYGFLCYMLQFRSPDQSITGVDYDLNKIETANHGYLKSEHLQFHQADVMEFIFDRYSGIVLSDVLHYLQPSEQRDLLEKCCEKLLPGGIMIISDGNTDSKERHSRTQLSEFFSIHLLQFNKSNHILNFPSAESIRKLVETKGLTFELIERSKFTSNVVMVVRKGSDSLIVNR